MIEIWMERLLKRQNCKCIFSECIFRSGQKRVFHELNIAALCIGMSRLTLLNSQEREKVSIEGTQQNGWSAQPSPARASPAPAQPSTTLFGSTEEFTVL